MSVALLAGRVLWVLGGLVLALPALGAERQELLVLSDDFAIQSVRLSAPVEEARSLRGLAHALPGATVLAVRKGSEFIGEPPADIDLREGDELILYGRRGELGGTE